ncbi:MAG: DUF4065 domain-containing protein [Clostridia bacterium]|nr:DUF4065 domain-containing protein [Clostridia bacterium]
MYDVLDVCRHIINYSNDKDYGISNLKLQKVLYFIQVWYWLKKEEPCFNESIEAWDFGPVVPEAYREYKQFGAVDIPSIHSYIQFDNSDFWNSKRVEFKDDVIQPKDKRIIDQIVDDFSKYSASTLVRVTHNQTPWKDAYKKGRGTIITKEAIRGYFIES